MTTSVRSDHRDDAEPTFLAAITFARTGERDVTNLLGRVLSSGSPDRIGLAIVASGSRQAIADFIEALRASGHHVDKPSVPRHDHPLPGPTDTQCSWADLTRREQAVAQLAGQALTNRQIARRLHISPHTVNYHLRRVFQKLNIESRVRLAAYVPRQRQPPQ